MYADSTMSFGTFKVGCHDVCAKGSKVRNPDKDNSYVGIDKPEIHTDLVDLGRDHHLGEYHQKKNTQENRKSSPETQFAESKTGRAADQKVEDNASGDQDDVVSKI